MSGAWLHDAILRAASLLVPGDQRAEWMEEWRSELWYIPRGRATIFCMGAFRDAFWVRRNGSVPVKRARIFLESPLSCLAFLTSLLLATLAAGSIIFAFRGEAGSMKTHDLAGISIGVQLLSLLLLPAALWIWMPPASRYSVSWRTTVRRGIFLALKIALVQSIVFGRSLILIFLGPIGRLGTIAGGVAVVFALRWVMTDQKRRCPVCLRLLTDPVLIGTSARTLLGWYGTESTCPHGHGLLHTSEYSSSYSRPQWLGFGDFWRS